MELIDKNALNFTEFEIVMCDGDFKKAFKLICEKLDNAPIIEAEPIRHGHWIKSEKSDYHWECSNCGYGLTDYRTTYCYDCGARMDEVEE